LDIIGIGGRDGPALAIHRREGEMLRKLLVCCVLAGGVACGSDGEPVATERGVGDGCLVTADCRNDEGVQEDTTEPLALLECLTEFKGGYCGLKGCRAHAECPEGSLCVIGDNGSNYCFLVCQEKADCNLHRPADIEANCSSNVELVDGAKNLKTCVPPSA